jgi:gamma-glutamylaminecyclotransferase
MKGALDTVEETKEKIFVYGTLKKGKQFNYLLSKAKFIGDAETVERYSLYFDGIPYLVKSDEVSYVKGEVYDIDSEMLKMIDAFEDHPNYYVREKIKVKLTSGDILSVWAYFFPEKRGKLIETGEY